MSKNFQINQQKIIDDLDVKAEEVFSEIAKLWPKRKAVALKNTRTFLKEELDDLGMDEILSQPYKRVYDRIKMQDRAGVPMTYHAIDDLRKSIGAGLNKKGGIFKDDEQGKLKNMYKLLLSDQESAASAFGFGEEFRKGRRLVSERKRIEENTIDLLGKNLEKQIMPETGGAVLKLKEGQTAKWKKIFSKIEDSEMKREVALSAFDYAFSGKKGGHRLSIKRFSEFMKALRKQKGAKDLLFQHVGKDAREMIESLETISHAVSRTLDKRVYTGRLNSFDNVINKAANVVGAAGEVAAGGAGAAAASTKSAQRVVKELIRGDDEKLERARDLLNSRELINYVKEQAKSGNLRKISEEGKKRRMTPKMKSLEKKMAGSKAYQAWAQDLSEGQKAEIASLGLFHYLFVSDKEVGQAENKTVNQSRKND